MHNHTEFNGTKTRSFRWRLLRIIGLTIGGLFLAALFALVLGIVAQMLWNWLMPDIFGLKEISYWQAVGLLFLGRLLFGGFGHSGSHHHKKRSDLNPKDWQKYGRVWRERSEEAAEEMIGGARKDRPAESRGQGSAHERETYREPDPFVRLRVSSRTPSRRLCAPP
jgi:hypothetical protein